MTAQIDLVRELARRGEICAIRDFYGAYLPNGRNAISDLELRFAWEFARRWERHGSVRHLHYRLVREGRSGYAPRRAVQQRLIAI